MIEWARKFMPLIAGLAVSLCVASSVVAQDKEAPPPNSEQATRRSSFIHCIPALADQSVPFNEDEYQLISALVKRIADNVERTIKAREPKWRLRKSRALGYVFTQEWESGSRRLSLEIFACESSEAASQSLFRRGVFSITSSEELADFGDEARYISYPYFTWVGVRKGRLVAGVQGPGRALATTRRFAQYALEQLEDPK